MQMQPKLDELKIDPEFESKIPPLTKEEFDLLEQNIVEDGRVFDPLFVWNGTILDGHHRYRILKKYPEIPYNIVNMTFPDKYYAIAWMCRKQLGRRNLTPEQRKYLAGKQYEAEKTSHGGKRDNTRDENGRFTASLQNEDLRTTERIGTKIAEELNTSRSFVERAEKFAKGVDAAEEILPGIKQEILSGSIKPTHAAVAAVARADPEERVILAEQLRQPRARPCKTGLQTGEAPACPADGMTGIDHDASEEDGEQPGLTARDNEPPEEDEEDQDEEDTVEEELDEALHPVRIPKKSEIMALAKEMEHSEGQVLGTVEDMIYEMNSALQDMIWRWNFCREAYVKPIRSRDGKNRIKELAAQGIEYLKDVRKGILWKDEPV